MPIRTGPPDQVSVLPDSQCITWPRNSIQGEKKSTEPGYEHEIVKENKASQATRFISSVVQCGIWSYGPGRWGDIPGHSSASGKCYFLRSFSWSKRYWNIQLFPAKFNPECVQMGKAETWVKYCNLGSPFSCTSLLYVMLSQIEVTLAYNAA